MKARLLLKERHVVRDGAFAELVVWQLPKGSAGSKHGFKYRLAFIVDGTCVPRYDNEQGKSDHRHIGALETPYHFTSPEQLIADFWRDIDDRSL